ncbi:carbohydrate esterase family 1 protein (macronuclear) [Tetrahymena thermophila SB210]|uniref:Carbohydrate esterase family 1 protein n=1 Tax=Tetrahymena thermophila (strain SB210) TaxID=312017 RepID=Q24D84_TETTS|nr:carbohydrate esterase family 1 protein [Tetrahymena thermophila SB210]EAS05761.1 carbohydrate esterase family 1 protein [Tetrahymena thermophila SB210]|eukprot:XP_001026006.1 carbohydrate esterase family 1 protein [Tetrahymena thermophila SB210]
MKEQKKGESSEAGKMSNVTLKKSYSQKVENNKTSGSSKNDEFQSQHSEASLPDSSRVRRDGRKRMKKTISNKVYENMQSQDVSKVDDSNLQQINIDTSINKDNNTHQYNAIDFMSLNGLSEQTMHNEQTQPAQNFLGGTFKGQVTSSYQNAGSQKNSNLSIQQQLDSNIQQQNQGISQFYASADGAQMPRRIDNRNRQVIDLNQVEEQPKLGFKQRLCRIIALAVFLGYLLFNIYMTFQQSEIESGQLRGRDGDEMYPHAKEELKKEIEDMRLFSKQIEKCQLNRQEFIKQYRKKEYFFDISTCEWLKTCSINTLVYSSFCLANCPNNYKNISSTCISDYQAQSMKQCPEDHFQYGIERKNTQEMQLYTCSSCQIENCFSCISKSFCQICYKDYFLENGKCVKNCQQNHNEDYKTQSCILDSNSDLKVEIKFLNSKILAKRIFYEVIFSPAQFLNKKTQIQYLYFINDRENPTNQIQSIYDNLAKKLQEIENFILISIPSIPDAFLRDTSFYSFFNQELIPQIESHYQVPFSHYHRLIAGEGFGGLQALYIATMSRPLFQFGFVGLINPYISVNDIEETDRKKLFITSQETISQVKFDFANDFKLKTTIYTDFNSQIQNNQRPKNTYSELVSKLKEANSSQEMNLQEPNCEKNNCTENKYFYLFQAIISYNKLLKEEQNP